MTRRYSRTLVAVAALLCLARAAAAQAPTQSQTAQIDCVLHARWTIVLSDATKARGANLASMSEDEKRSTRLLLASRNALARAKA